MFLFLLLQIKDSINRYLKFRRKGSILHEPPQIHPYTRLTQLVEWHINHKILLQWVGFFVGAVLNSIIKKTMALLIFLIRICLNSDVVREIWRLKSISDGFSGEKKRDGISFWIIKKNQTIYTIIILYS